MNIHKILADSEKICYGQKKTANTSKNMEQNSIGFQKF